MTDETVDTGVGESDAAKSETQQDDIDALLAEFERGDNASDDKAAAGSRRSAIEANDRKAQFDRMVREHEEMRVSRAREETETNLKNTVAMMKGNERLKNIDDAVLEGMFMRAAYRDPALDKAFVNQRSNPAAFKKLVAKLAEDFTKHLSFDAATTGDREAVLDAVRGRTSTRESKDTDEEEALKRARGSREDFFKYWRSKGLNLNG